MLRKFLIPAIALLGICIAVVVVLLGTRKTPPQPIPYPPPKPPFAHYIAGPGVIESSSLDIIISPPFNELVTDVFVYEGDLVKAGDALFKLNTQTLEAQYNQAQKEKELAIVTFQDQRTQWMLYEQLDDKRAVSQNEYNQRYFAMAEAEKQIEVKQALMDIYATNIERSVVRAPVDGLILQVKIRPGESGLTNPFNDQAAMVMGVVNPLQMRIDIDEEDAWRYQKGARARAYVRGNSAINFPMEFFKVEPYIIPKASFTGESTERVDTRVLQVLYRFEKKNLPVYAGQILDIYIEYSPVDEEHFHAPKCP
jgi:HlyD family secretion protein